MSVIEQLDSLIQTALQSGFEVRYDYLGGTGGGVCEYNGKRWLFVDLALSAEESWELLHEALRQSIERSKERSPQILTSDRQSTSDRKVA